MSIATLKKKTNAQYNRVSVGYSQFSINGTHRSQGYVGQDMISRHLPITHRRGVAAVGTGGCCNTYKQENITCGAGITSLNDPTVVKPSVLTTSGRLSNMKNCDPNKCISKTKQFSTVKYIPPYQDVLQRKKKTCLTQKSVIPDTCNTCVNNLEDNQVKHAFKYMYKRNIDFLPSGNVTKNVNTKPCSDVVESMHSACLQHDKVTTLHKVKIPYACH